VAKGIWWLAGQSHHSVLVEFSDHLMLIEAPQNDTRTLAVIAKARELVPGKPLTQIVKRAVGKPVVRSLSQVAHDQRRNPRPRRLRRLELNAVVAHLRVCKHHHLPMVRGIGRNFLVPGHRRVEDHLAVHVDAGAEALTPE
jgi:hypothetical protein